MYAIGRYVCVLHSTDVISMLQTNSTWFPTCPIIGGHTGYGDVCPRGYYCVLGSTLPQGCPAGTYQDEEGQDDCKECPEGMMTINIAWLVCSVVHAAVFFFQKKLFCVIVPVIMYRI